MYYKTNYWDVNTTRNSHFWEEKIKLTWISFMAPQSSYEQLSQNSQLREILCNIDISAPSHWLSAAIEKQWEEMLKLI